MKYKFDKVEMANIQVPNFINIEKNNKKEYVPFGDDNLFPQKLIELSNKGTTHPQCLNLIQKAVMGDGYTVNNELAKVFLDNLDYETSNCSLLEKVSYSMSKFYGACIEVIYNKFGDKIVQAQFLSFENVRCGKPDKYGNVNEYFYNADWENSEKNYEEIPAFNPKKVLENGVVVQPKQLLYIAFYTDLSKCYPIPDYFSAANYIMAEHELSIHMLSSITNGFIPSSLITFIGKPTDEERRLNKQMFEKSFTGSENSGKIIINYAENAENKVQIDSITSANVVDEYLLASQEAKQNIITANGIVSPSLVAISDGNSSIFGNGDELKTAWDVFYKIKIASYQLLIEKSFDLILKYSGFPNSNYKIKPFSPINQEEVIEENNQENN